MIGLHIHVDRGFDVSAWRNVLASHRVGVKCSFPSFGVLACGFIDFGMYYDEPEMFKTKVRELAAIPGVKEVEVEEFWSEYFHLDD